MYPQYFVSLTGFPGYLPDESESRMNALKPLCIYMHVGERDVEWLTPIQRQSELLDQKGLRVHFIQRRGKICADDSACQASFRICLPKSATH